MLSGIIFTCFVGAPLLGAAMTGDGDGIEAEATASRVEVAPDWAVDGPGYTNPPGEAEEGETGDGETGSVDDDLSLEAASAGCSCISDRRGDPPAGGGGWMLLAAFGLSWRRPGARGGRVPPRGRS